MIPLFTGYHCWLIFQAGIPTGVARLTKYNEAKLKDGSTVRILINGEMKLLKVVILPDELTTEEDKRRYGNTILLSEQLATQDMSSSYWRGSNFSHAMQLAFGTRKAKLSLVATCVSMVLAVGAAYNGSQTNCHEGLKCMSIPTRIMAGLSVLSAMVAWAKDIV